MMATANGPSMLYPNESLRIGHLYWVRPVFNIYFGADLPQHRFRERCKAFEVESNRTAKTSFDPHLTQQNTTNPE